MANSTIPNLVAVTVPALTDLFGVRQSGDTRDKKLTVTQLLTLVPSGGDVSKVGTPVDNQLAVWTGDGTLEGDTNFDVIAGVFQGTNSSGPGVLNEGASSVNPSLVPNKTDLDSGIGQNAADQLSLIAGGVEIARAIEAVASNQFAIVSSGSSAVPELAGVADLDTGLHWLGGNELGFLSGGVKQFSVVGNQFQTAASQGPSLVNAAVGLTSANIRPSQSDADTGIGADDDNQLSLIAGGVVQLQISAVASAFFQAGTNAAADGGDLDLSSGDSGVAATGDGGAVNILAGESLATAGDGGVVSIKSGAGILSGAGGDILLEVGTGGAAGPGTSGNFFVNTLVGLTADGGLHVPIPGLTAIYGLSRSGEGVAGDLELWAGYAAGTGGGSVGGDLLLFGGGQGGGAGAGGNAHLYGGESDTQPGFAEVEGGTATVGGGGGQARVLGGPGFGGNFGGGPVIVQGGLGVGVGAGGQVNLVGGNTGTGATGNAGGVQITGGEALSTDGDGGDITLQSGRGNGSGADGDIILRIRDTEEFRINAALGIHGVIATGPAMLNETPTFVNPTLVPNQTDLDTGLGWDADDQLSLVIGGVSGILLRELNSGVIQAPDAEVAITAFATGGQANATQLNQSNNVIATVATTGDSVKLPPIFETNSVIFVKNDGVNAADIFPATGDDLGAGLNTAVSLAAGESASFIATAGGTTWTPWIVSVGGGGGGDVTKVGTPVNNQVGVWTGDGTLEGDADLLFDGTILTMGLSSRVRTGVGTTSQAAFGFTTEINTGIYRQGAGSLGITLQGAGNWLFQAGSFFANVSAGPQMVFEAASATNPTFIPRLSDMDSGIGSAAADQVNLIAGGLSCMSVRETGSARQIGFYVTDPISLQTGVAISSAGIHAALVALGLITA